MATNAEPQVGYLRLPEVLEIFPIARSTWWAGVKSGKFPAPIKLSPRTTAWRRADILNLIASIDRQQAQD
jgi:predicted DNA-binding transcriptional regulator AlpA